MGWQDAPLVQQSAPKWASAPLVNAQPTDEQRPGYLDNLKAATEKAGAADIQHPGQAVPGMLEAGLNAVTGAVSPIPGAVTALVGRMGLDPDNPTGDYQKSKEFYTYQPRTESGQARAEQIGAAMRPVSDVMGKVGEYAGKAARTVGLPEQIAGDAEKMVPDMLSIATARAPEAVGGIKRSLTERANAPKEPTPPTKQQLSEQADAAYKRADDSGVVVTPESFDGVRQRILAMAQKQGIDPALHPDATAALARVVKAEGPQTLQQLETLRKISSDAEGSIKPADSRLASQMTDELDDYIDSLSDKDVVAGDATKAQALKEARDLYSRKKKTDAIDELVRRAELSAPNYSGSGMENALRTEFRALAKNQRRFRRFTPEEQAAIERVAKGGPAENALRMFGKLAPTGAVSGALSSGAGFLAGGPVGAVAVPALGFGARRAATGLTSRNVQLAQELMRRGPRGDVPAQAPSAEAQPSPASVLFLPRPAANESNSQMPQDLAASLNPNERRKRALAMLLMQQGLQ
jgi:hypothetical protein